MRTTYSTARRFSLYMPVLLATVLLGCGGGTRAADAPAHDSAAMAAMSADAPGDGVRLSAEMLRTFGVTFDTVGMRPLVDSIRAMGVVRWDETQVHQVTARVMGYVERLRVAATGQTVSTGDTLLTLYAPEVVAALDELRTAAALDREGGTRSLPGIPVSSAALVSSARARLARWDVPSDLVARVLDGRGEVPRTMPLRATGGGIVIDKAVEVGQAVQPGDRLYSIVDPSVVWLDAEFREADAASVVPGRAVGITFTGDHAERRTGRISFVYPTIDPTTRTVRARIVLENRSRSLQAGRFAEVQLVGMPRTELTVPTSAVIATGEGYLVFRDAGDGLFQPVKVEVGQSGGGLTVIRAGLTAGIRVVTSAQYLLEAESNLGAVMRSMLGQMGSGMSGSMPGMDHGTMNHDSGAAMPGMDHGTMNHDSPAAPPAMDHDMPMESGTSMPGMDHGAMKPDSSAPSPTSHKGQHGGPAGSPS